MIKPNTKVTDAIEKVMNEIEKGGVSFDECLRGVRELGIKNQKVITVILTAIGRVYTK